MSVRRRGLLELCGVLLACACGAPVQGDTREGGRRVDGGTVSSSSTSSTSSSGGGGSTTSSTSASSSASSSTGGCPTDALFTTLAEPRHTIAALNGVVVTSLPAVARYEADATALLVAQGEPPVAGTRAVGILDDGRWSAARSGQLVTQGDAPLLTGVGEWTLLMETEGERVVLPWLSAVIIRDVANATWTTTPLPAPACLAPAVATWDGDLVIAAPEWRRARVKRTAGWVELDEHGAFGARDPFDPSAWAEAPLRRVLVAVGGLLFEAASMGFTARFVAHAEGVSTVIDIPGSRSVVMGAAGSGVAWVLTRNASGGSEIIVVGPTAGSVVLTAADEYQSLAVDGDRLYASTSAAISVFAVDGTTLTVLGEVLP